MAAKLPPTPWKAWQDGDDRFIVGHPDERHGVMLDGTPASWFDVAERIPNEATAKLLAAAPDLADALQEARKTLMHAVEVVAGNGKPAISTLVSAKQRIDAALAKAGVA